MILLGHPQTPPRHPQAMLKEIDFTYFLLFSFIELALTLYNTAGILLTNPNVKVSMPNLMATFMNSKESALGTGM